MVCLGFILTDRAIFAASSSWGWPQEGAGRPRSTNGEMEGERKGEPCLQGALVSNARKFTNLAPV